MRRSELDPKIAQLAQTLFADAREVLAIGFDASLSERRVTTIDDPNEVFALGRPFEAALFRLSAADTASARAALVAVRSVLGAGAPVLLAAEKRAPALDQLRAVFAREPVPRARLEALCEAALLSGLVAPRVHESASGWLLVAAHVPAIATALDGFFAQPAGQLSR
jgi:hypothetical protein